MEQNYKINGIQQIGVGIDDVQKAFRWYGVHLGADINVFEDSNTATHMAQYMGGQPHKKCAILALNLQGGGGYELWQYLDRKPQASQEIIQTGDLGIFLAKIKTQDITQSFERLRSQNVKILSDIETCPDGSRCFFIQDPWDNILQVQEFTSWFMKKKKYDTGGVFGCMIGVSNIDISLKLYQDILGYDQVIYDKTGTFEDLQKLPNGNQKFRRILLTHSENRTGGFAPLLGRTQIELIQAIDYIPKKIYANRYWGDIGYIHLCFDVRNIGSLIQTCDKKGFPFHVKSGGAFDMGEANGAWGYIEDSDGTLIEFVETFKVALIKPLGLNINLTKRDADQPLPAWIIKAMSLRRKRFDKN